MTDTIVLLKTMRGRRMTKLWRADNTVDGYEDAKNFKMREESVSSFAELSAMLKRIEPMPDVCMIRGAYVGDELAEAPEYPGYVRKALANFKDQALHAVMFDIDKYQHDGAPEVAIDAWVAEILPACFHGAQYHWQLSSSAGREPGTLKAHVWFWLSEPRSCADLRAWALHMDVDHSVFNPVQAHFTAAPVFEEGVIDPVAVRSGVSVGWFDSVDLQIEAQPMREVGSGSSIAMADPREKPGVIGAFCRAFSFEEIMVRWLSDRFTFESDDNARRLTYKKGGGAPGGAFITDDRLHLINKHATDPCLGRAVNAFDLVRVHMFGHLDEGADVLDLAQIQSTPSHLAMVDWARALPEVARELGKGEEVARDWADKVAAASDYSELEQLVETIAAGVGEVEKGRLLPIIHKRFRDFEVDITKPVVRRMLSKKRRSEASREVGDTAALDWLMPYVWINAENCFVNRETQEPLSVQSFNANFDREVLNVWMTADGRQMRADAVALTHVQVETFDRRMYLPPAGADFEFEGMRHLNRYRPDLVPLALARTAWSTQDEQAVDTFVDHIRIICGELADYVLAWMAHNVQHPGLKILNAPLIKGIEGDGKTVMGKALAKVMGSSNVGVIGNSELTSPFNDWAAGRCVVIVEEISVPGHNRHDVTEKMKPIITNETISIHGKGDKPVNVINTQNYIFFTNNVTALPLTEIDRRYAIIFSPYSELSEIRALQESGYFDALHNAVDNHSAALRQYFLGYDLSKFNRKAMAPNSAAKELMIAADVSDEEELLLDLINEGGLGVCKEVVSTKHLNQMLMMRESNVMLRGGDFRRVMKRLGYHRPKNPIKWRGAAVRVWVKDHKMVNDNEELFRLLEGTTVTF